jgi:hypothetical protein
VLTIRPAQMSVFEAAQRARFVDQLLETLSHAYPHHRQAMGSDGLRALIVLGIALGERHGVRLERPVSVLIELMVAFGESFERSRDRAWATETLAHPTLPGALKVRLMEDRMFRSTGGRGVIEQSVERGPRQGREHR